LLKWWSEPKALRSNSSIAKKKKEEKIKTNYVHLFVYMSVCEKF
jgi:hypothetical protein